MGDRKKFLEDYKVKDMERLEKQRNTKQKRTEQRNKRAALGVGLGTAALIGGITVAGANVSGKKEVISILPDKKEAVEKIEAKKTDAKKTDAKKTDYVQIIPSEDIEETVNNFKSAEEVNRYLNNEYIELYEKEMGESDLTTENIEIRESDQNYIYVNVETGDYITHGINPYETEDMLARENINYITEKNVKVYEVYHNGEVIDCIIESGWENEEEEIITSKYVRVIPGGSEYKQQYKSILEKMGVVIKTGIEFRKSIEDKEKSQTAKYMAKAQFRHALKEWKSKQRLNITVKRDEGYEIGE